ncbi:MAG: DUF4974 domain-containing protein [Flavobacteriaceae bacterium]|nr:DUF4974 domain-containing protein [Flavobacteriaceae bacterium]
MQKRQILKFIKEELNEAEKQHVIDWIRNHSDNQKRYNILKATYIASSFNETSTYNSDFFFKKFNKKVRVKNNYKYVAIVTSFVLISFFSFNYFNQTEVLNKTSDQLKELVDINIINTVTSKGGNSNIILPDGSKVVLNADSKLSYPKIFNDSIRNVVLIGEAFFDIEHDSKRPFIVDANEIKIKVLGTTFNVKSYSKDEKIETTLVTGKVELIKDNETPVILAPSQKAVFYKTQNKLKIEKVNSSNVVAWRKGKLVFKNTSMKEVVIDLERKYNVKFTINSQKLLEYEYTGTFDNLSIDEVLKLLIISSPISYTIKDEKINLDMN